MRVCCIIFCFTLDILSPPDHFSLLIPLEFEIISTILSVLHANSIGVESENHNTPEYPVAAAACNLVYIASPFAGIPPDFMVQSVRRSIGGLRTGDCKSIMTWRLMSQSWWWRMNRRRPHSHVSSPVLTLNPGFPWFYFPRRSDD